VTLRACKLRNGRAYDPPANMSCETAAVVARAFDIATALRAKELSITHLWAALASEPSIARSLWFGTLQRPDDCAEAQVRRRLLRRWKVPNLQRSPQAGRPRLPLSSLALGVLWRTVEEACQLGHADIGPEHLLLALMHAKRAALFKNAETYSLTYVSIRHEVVEFRRTNRAVEAGGRKRQTLEAVALPGTTVG
jgi:ATP-dependent Clp protease ATP-binding subunit ClpA